MADQVPALLWVIFTVIAATAQTFRNAAQKSLIDKLGTIGATHVRFLFGLPFALIFLAACTLVWREIPSPNSLSLLWTVFGAITQIIATALMLAAEFAFSPANRGASWSLGANLRRSGLEQVLIQTKGSKEKPYGSENPEKAADCIGSGDGIVRLLEPYAFAHDWYIVSADRFMIISHPKRIDITCRTEA